MSVSRQASRLVGAAPAIAAAHFRAEADPYDPLTNLSGYFNLGTAENRMVWDLVEPWLAGPRSVRAADTRYAPLHGSSGLRTAIAGLLSGGSRVTLDPDDLIVVSGATAALDMVATALCDPGDAIVVPAPYYGAFDTDLCGRSGARLIGAPLDPADGFRLRGETIERALSSARRAGANVRAIAMTSPYNPVGHVYDARTLAEVLAVAADHDVDVIVDEVYAHSVFGSTPFVSLLDPAVSGAASDRVHVIWGFAKDFGLPGLKVGVLHTRDRQIAAAARALAYFAPISTDTQALLTTMLDDLAWVQRFLAISRDRLAESYARAAATLDACGIDYLPAAAGFSIWVDLRAWIADATADAERDLWRMIFDTARVNILPGAAFASPEAGWFRLCHTTDPAIVREAIERTARLLPLTRQARVPS